MNKILITGASSAIGKRLIRKIDKKNQIIFAHYNKSKVFTNFLKKNKFKSKIITFKSNFSKKSDIKKFVKKTKNFTPDCILHLASHRIEAKRFSQLNIKDYANEISLSFNSIFEILKIHLPDMLKKRKGKVIFILSSVTLGDSSSYLSHYACLKYMLLGLMKSLSSEYKTSGINFNAISPSMMDTPFIIKLGYKFIELNKYLSSSKDLLEIDDVVSKITFLMSSKSDDLNGVNIPLTKSK